MSAEKIVAVIAATGTQGSSVSKVFLNLPGWKVRCVTRRAISDKAKALAALGAEIVQADLADVDSPVTAFEGANAIFVNTDFGELLKNALAAGNEQNASVLIAYNTELRNAKNAAIAASKIPGLERYVYSALDSVKAASNGKYSRSLHWESKAAAVKFIEQELPELAKKTSLIYIGVYNSNAFLYPNRNPQSGKYSLVLPVPKETRFQIIDAARSTGHYVRALVEDEEPGTKLFAYEDDLSVAEAIDAWSKVTGEEVDFVQLPVQTIHELSGVPMEFLEAPAYLEEYSYTAGVEGVITPDKLKTKIQLPSYQEFLVSEGREKLLGA
ncbi:hypothetical protein AK830_g6827 [Neonectria ditissima]|uniref:NmrA-like domain-containing protein n=1 Tax=Neonectria ditissima TaxID=78410 RepID=A0A0P7BHK1_9HYPO|nr:hypothetical protein AK830_g6827 [Neonectria ditissima]